MRYIPRSVMVGFVNALAILIFIAQVPQLIGVPWAVYPIAAAGLAIMYLLPRVTKAIPAPLVAIVLLTGAAVVFGISVPTVGDQGALPESLPALLIPNVPFTLDTLGIIFPFAVAMAVVGLLESLMTAALVDDITDTPSSKTRESLGQGAANVLSGLFGGMGGCAMIGQTMINVKASGARTRISTFLAGVFLLLLVLAFGDVVAIIPMAALVAVMIVVSIATFDWHSIRPSTLRRMPLSETIVMVLTVAVTVWTHNLAIGVGVGVVAAAVLFARRVASLTSVTRSVEGDTARYVVEGELFFASSNDLTTRFAYHRDPAHVVIDLSRSHVWDASTVAALDAVRTKYAHLGTTVELEGMNDTAARFHDRLSGGLGAGHDRRSHRPASGAQGRRGRLAELPAVHGGEAAEVGETPARGDRRDRFGPRGRRCAVPPARRRGAPAADTASACDRWRHGRRTAGRAATSVPPPRCRRAPRVRRRALRRRPSPDARARAGVATAGRRRGRR